MKLMKIYYLTLQTIAELHDDYHYKEFVQELTRYRMKVVDETENIRKIEEEIGWGCIEELIYQAHNELKLMRIIKTWKPWDNILKEQESDKDFYYQVANFKFNEPMADRYENFVHDKNSRPERPPTAGVHPEDIKQ